MIQIIPKLLSASAVVALVLGSCAGGENDPVTFAEPELLDSHYGDGEPMWVGTVERRHLMQSPFDDWLTVSAVSSFQWVSVGCQRREPPFP